MNTTNSLASSKESFHRGQSVRTLSTYCLLWFVARLQRFNLNKMSSFGLPLIP